MFLLDAGPSQSIIYFEISYIFMIGPITKNVSILIVEAIWVIVYTIIFDCLA